MSIMISGGPYDGKEAKPVVLTMRHDDGKNHRYLVTGTATYMEEKDGQSDDKPEAPER